MLALIYGVAWAATGALLFFSVRRYVTDYEATWTGIVLGAIWPITLVIYAVALFAAAVARKEPT